MAEVFELLRERGFVQQITHEDELVSMLGEQSMSYYVGFDPTADSLHIGHFIPVMAMRHLQNAGHRPIALVGGGTARVGDPSGKTDMRRMMDDQEMAKNVAAIKGQLSRFLDFSEGKAILADNADWLLGLNYIDFLREVGVHFSVNRMLTADCYKQRLERGLTFFEFNYMLMQSYDFLELYRRYGCRLQLGGDDQWSNILSGADLIRRKERQPAFALTCPLLLNSDGTKMGKTVAGALWLDANKTSPYDFYQYWRSVEDAVVEKCLKVLTFLPMDEVRRLAALKDAAINEAKQVLAFEITKIVHGEEAATAAMKAAEALFSGGGDDAAVPEVSATVAFQQENGRVIDALVLSGLAASRGEARRLIQQGGIQLDGEKVTDVDAALDWGKYTGGTFLLKKGKKGFFRVRVEG